MFNPRLLSIDRSTNITAIAICYGFLRSWMTLGHEITIGETRKHFELKMRRGTGRNIRNIAVRL